MLIEVHGVGEDQHPFREATHTLVINAHGALIGLAHPVEVGQQIILKNPKSQEMQACRVVHSGTAVSGKTHVGVEFLRPAPNFWQIAFPPDDWKPQDPQGGRGQAE